MKIIVFENLAPAHALAAVGYGLCGYQVRFLRSDWTGASRVARRLPLKEPLYLRSNPAGDKAFVFTDSLYETVFQQHPLVARMQALYQDERVHWVFKKYLNSLLEQYFHYLYLGERIRDSLPPAASILFVPERISNGSLPPVTGGNLPPWNLPFLKGKAWERMTPPFAFGIPGWVRARGKALELLDLFRTFSETALFFGWKFFFGRRKAAPVSRPFGIAIVTPAREFANPFRAYDMLLDGEKIRKDNTLFIPMAHLSPAQRRALADKGLALAEMSCRMSGRLMGRLIRSGLSLAREFSRAPWWIARVSVYLWRDYGIWESFLENYAIRHFINYNELSFRPVARSLLLGRHGVQTWYYADTVNTSNIYILGSQQVPYRQSIWGYLLYDHFISWNKSLSEYHRKHHQNEAMQYHEVGCLWSEHIRLVKEGRLPSPLRERFSQWEGSSGRKVVAVFDSSYHPDSITSYKDGIAFAQGIARLLDEMPDLCVIWKEKKDRNQLRQLSVEMDQVYQQLSRHPRIFFCGYKVAPSEVLALCDLAVSFPFTSVTVEALGARVKAIYYDPQSKVYGPYDTQIPGLVTHGFDQLKRRVEELAAMSPEAYDRTLDQVVLGALDPYLDGRGLSRFRDLLCRESAPSPKTSKEIPNETALISR